MANSLPDIGTDAEEAERAREVWAQRMALGVKSNRRGIEDEYIGRAVGATITSLGELADRLKEESTSAALGGDFDPKETVETGLDLATGGSTRALRGGVNVGLGIFGGRLSPKANLPKLRQAEKMDEMGLDKADIRAKTGWHKDIDGEWRFEISDKAARYKREPALDRWRRAAAEAEGEQPLQPLGERFTHKELEKAYPGILQEIKIGSLPDSTDRRIAGDFNPYTNVIRLHPDISPAQARSFLLHELSHYVQGREGFGQGANLSMPRLTQLGAEVAPRFQKVAQDFVEEVERKMFAFAEQYPVPSWANSSPVAQRAAAAKLEQDFWEANPGLRGQYEEARKIGGDLDVAKNEGAFRAYRRVSGETEARNAQKRADLSPAQRRATPPWETADYPPEAQILIPSEQRVLPFATTGRVEARTGRDDRIAHLAPDTAAPGGRREAITAVNLRTMPYDEAVKIAQSQRHLIPSNSGGLVGAPNWVQTPEDIARMRDQFDLAVEGGAPGGRWYSEGQRANREIAGPDPAANRRVARGEGLFSSQANPDTNLGFLLNAHNAFIAGRPLPKVRTGQQAREFNAAAAEGRDIRLGKKTEIYSDHLDPTVGDPNTGTNDIWHARSFGYVDDKGKPWDKALTAQQHAFMDAETILAVQRANEKKVGGRSDWTPGEVQAAAWVYSKGKDLAKKRYGGDLARGVAEAAKGYEASFDKYTAHGVYEEIPGAMTRHLTGLTQASQAERAAFSNDPRSRWMTPEGRDILYGAAGMYQRPTLEATGLYTPPGGVPEMNPANVARPLVGMTGKTGAREVDPASRSLMDAVEAARAYLDVQGAGAWSKPIAGNRMGSSTSVQLTGEAPLSVEQMQALQAAGAKLGTPDVVDYGRGAMLTNFNTSADPKALGTALRKGGTAELEGIVPGSSPRRAALDSGYIGYEKAWGKDEGSGAVTRELKKRLAGKDAPRGLVAKFDSDPMIRQVALDRLTRDIEHAQATGRPIRQDVQLAREIIAKDGFAGLFAALKKGAALPAALAPLISGILAERED